MSTILVAEQDFSLRARLANGLRQRGHHVNEACGGVEALQQLEQCLFEAILTDFRLPEKSGIEVLHMAQTADEVTPVFILTDPEDIPSAFELLRLGAYDYLLKHAAINPEEVSLRVERALEHRRLLQATHYLRRVHPYIYDCERIIGHSVYLQHILSRLQREIATNAHVMIRGEPGTGKGLLAAAIHAHSPRSEQTLVAVDCAALPERTLESELFGHERRAFPGAQTRYIGGLEHAHQGTLFLHQVGELSPRIQVKILRVLQEQTFERLGSSRTIYVDVRVVASTNRNLTEAIRARRFRADLYARLNAITVDMPALRDCPEDIMPLARAFLQRYNRLFARRVKRFDESAQRVLLGYSWPGNLRELESTIAHAVSQETGEAMGLSSLGLGERRSSAGASQDRIVHLPSNGASLKDIEREALIQALQHTNWVQKDAAVHLDITPRVMHYKLKTHGITPPRRSPRR
ncbi:MAG TPA: sigma-54 dependent transcriptional regulator [Candidatus Tectomicrobia bacterium]|nr:sigma-54 dependent transcriptional regulator [Candidatus Tectomicrobia bacterium]